MIGLRIGQTSTGMFVGTLLLALLWANQGTSTATDTAVEADNRHMSLEELSNATTCGTYDGVPELLKKYVKCLPAVSVISNSKPTKSCCSEVKSTGLTCLCSLFVKYRERIPNGIVESDKIMEVPSKCGMPIPKGSTCDGEPVPTAEETAARLNSGDTSDHDIVDFGWVRFNP